jgi:hypothetical protein
MVRVALRAEERSLWLAPESGVQVVLHRSQHEVGHDSKLVSGVSGFALEPEYYLSSPKVRLLAESSYFGSVAYQFNEPCTVQIAEQRLIAEARQSRVSDGRHLACSWTLPAGQWTAAPKA